MLYLLDVNVLITANLTYYPLDQVISIKPRAGT